MRSTKRASFYFFTAAVVLVPAMAITACGDDDTGSAPVTLLDGSASDARTTSDGQVTPLDANSTVDAPSTPAEGGTDAGEDVQPGPQDAGSDADASTTLDADASTTPDADASTTPDADASSNEDADAEADAGDAGKPASVPNGTYQITSWTCTHAGGPKDILATANGLGIIEVDETINGPTGSIDSIYSATCTRSTATAITYPEAGKVTFTTNALYTCSATCAPATCTSGTQPIFTDTYDFTTTATTFTGTRTLDAAALGTAGQPTHQKVAGCDVGDVETATFTKK